MNDRRDEYPTAIPPLFDNPSTLEAEQLDGNIKLFRDVTYCYIAGYRPLQLDLFVPHGAKALVMWIHGGAFMLGTKNFKAPNDNPFIELRKACLDAGFAFASIDYRLSSEAQFPSQVHDVISAVRWLRMASKEIGVVSSKLAACGDSAGGHLALFAGTNTQNTDLIGDQGFTDGKFEVEGVVAWYPPTQLDTMNEQSDATSLVDHDAPDSPESRLIGATLSSSRGLGRLASPYAHAHKGSAPALLIHGDKDRLVPWLQSKSYADRLTDLGVENEFQLLEGADHGFFGIDISPVIESTLRFFKEKLA